jgi:hypothetical protein
MSYLDARRNYILSGRPLKKKEKKPLKPVSDKMAAKVAQEKKENAPGEDTKKEKWFKARRKELEGTCQCGCGKKSQKFDDMYFRHSIAHIFPKAKFESVMYHPLNFVERNWAGGCHSNMDNKSMDLWPNMADWDDIKAKFHELSPHLTEEDRKSKFYKHLESLVYAN